MSSRYATTVNEQADGADGSPGQRSFFAKDIPGRTDKTQKLGAASSNILNESFPQTSDIRDYNPREEFTNRTDTIAASANPDFAFEVKLDYSHEDGPYGYSLSSVVTDADVKDKPQYGAPNILVESDDIHDPTGDRVEGPKVPRRNAGFGVREVGGIDVASPAAARERLGDIISSPRPVSVRRATLGSAAASARTSD